MRLEGRRVRIWGGKKWGKGMEKCGRVEEEKWVKGWRMAEGGVSPSVWPASVWRKGGRRLSFRRPAPCPRASVPQSPA